MAASEAKCITVQIHNLMPEGQGSKSLKSLAEFLLSEWAFDPLVRGIARLFRLHGKEGAEDVANSALRVTFGGMREGKLKVACREDLIALLRTIAVRKAQNVVRHLNTQRQGGGAVRTAAGLDEATDPAPGPELIALENELCQHLYGVLGDDKLRQIARLRDEGLTYDEIGKRMGCSAETVRLRAKQIREIWMREVTDG